MPQQLFDFDPVRFVDLVIGGEPHIRVRDPGVCRKRCPQKPCTYICPSQVYSWDEKTGVQVDEPRCVECGACIWACPPANIDWNYPRGGYGVVFHY